MSGVFRRAPAWLLVLALALSLAACGGRERVDEIAASMAGLYPCQSLSLQGQQQEPGRTWLRLLPDGTGLLYLDEHQAEGTWTLEGAAFRWTPQESGEPDGRGTYQDGAIALTVGGNTALFVREGVDYVPEEERPVKPVLQGEVPAPEEPEEEEPALPADPGPFFPAPESPSIPSDKPGRTEEVLDEDPTFPAVTYACYNGLYYLEYDPQVFYPGPVGGADLVRDDGTQAWFARLETKALTDTWLDGLAKKEADELYFNRESHTTRAAGCPVQALVYQEAAGWTAEAVVELGENKGTKELPMYAIYLICRGPSREAVWTDGLESFLSTLRLGETGTGAVQ